MPVTATSSLALFLVNLQSLIAQSESFQAWTQSTTADDALRHVYIVEVDPPEDGQAYTPDELSKLRPFIVLNFHNRDGGDMTQVAQGTFVERIKFTINIEDDVYSEDATNYREAVLRFMNNVGGLISDMESLSGQSDNLNILQIRLEAPVTRSDQVEGAAEGDYHLCQLSCWAGSY